jgi:hypothetical protein
MSETTKKGLDEAEAGKKKGGSVVTAEEQEHPENAEAAEQEREDGPPGRGVER